MKTPLVILLALSLAGNAVLAVMSLRSSKTAASTAETNSAQAAASSGTAAKAAVATAKPAAAMAVTPEVWPTLKPNGSLKTLVANLRAAGFPPAVVRAVANQLISEQLGSAGENLPYWKQNFNNPDYQLARQQLSNRRREMFEDLLGADARPSAMIDATTREQRYGQLSDDKIDRIENLNRDINDLRTKLFADGKSSDPQGMMKAQAAAEQELKTELAAILTPEELEQFEMRSSNAANIVMRNLKGFDVSETEYAALYKAQKAFEAVDPMRYGGTFGADAIAARNVAQGELIEQARTVLTDDRFYAYLQTADPNYARLAQFTASYPNITPAMTYELSQIERNYQTTMMSSARAASGGNGAPSAERMTQITAARQDYQNKIAALLGPEAAAAYSQRNRGGTISTATRFVP